jgi:hypothetical protein
MRKLLTSERGLLILERLAAVVDDDAAGMIVGGSAVETVGAGGAGKKTEPLGNKVGGV